MSWDIVARALFVDNGAAAGLAKFNSQIHDVARAAPGGTRAFSMMERGLASLAFEAAGVTGPLGRVAEGLLKFGGGTTLVLGAAAGIGLIAEAYHLAAKEANDLADANERSAKQWRDLVAAGKPLVALQNQLSDAVAEQTTRQEKLNRLRATVQTPRGPVTRGTPGEIALAETGVSSQADVVDRFRRMLHDAAIQVEADAQSVGEKWATAFVQGISHLAPGVQIRTLLLAHRRFEEIGGTAGDIWATAFLKARGMVELRERLATLMTFPAGPLGTTRLPGLPPLTPGTVQLRGETNPRFIQDQQQRPSSAGGPGPEEKLHFPTEAVVASSLAVLGAIKAGGAGGAISGLGGLATSLSGAKGLASLSPIGIGLTALGGVVSLLDTGAERRHREMIRELKKISERPLPEAIRVQPIFVGAGRGDVAQLDYESQRREDRDAISRGVGGP